MRCLQTAAATFAVIALGCTGSRAVSPVTSQGVPAQVIPYVPEVGAPTFTTPGGSSSFSGYPGSGSGGDVGGAGVGGDGGTSLQNLEAQSYGQTAITTAQQLGVNPNAVAGIGQLESNFQNVGTANGSSSATGPWQITSGTWNDYVSKYNLPYTSADRTNPDAQAVVANYIIRDYSQQVSNAIGRPATVQQAYSAFVFGPPAGQEIAGADQSAPLSNFVSAGNLENNHMTGWTVGQFNNRVASKIGGVATQTVQS